MLTKGFLSKAESINNKNQRLSFFVNIVFYLGIFITGFCLGYMIKNMKNADNIVSVWMPFMVVGIVMISLSQIFKSIYLKKETDRRRAIKN